MAGSLSPALHQQEGEAQGLIYLYRRIDLERLGLEAKALGELLTAAERMGFDGLNITHPCKQRVVPLLDQLSEEADALGAVNTVVLSGGRRVGHNTDWFGFAENFRRFLPGAPLGRVARLGAGGAGAAAAYALARLGAREIAVADVELARAAALAETIAARFGAGRARTAGRVEEAVVGADGVVNATPVGMTGHPGISVSAGLLRPAMWVADIVYFPLETALLAAARRAGCRTLSGGGMAVFQAAEGFQLFSGVAPDAERMLAHFAALSGFDAGRG